MLQILHVVVIGKFKLCRSIQQAIFSTLCRWDDVINVQKKRILYHKFKGLKAPTITMILVEEEGFSVTRKGIQSFLKRYCGTRTIGRWPGNGRPSVISEDVKKIVRLKCRQVLNFMVPCSEID